MGTIQSLNITSKCAPYLTAKMIFNPEDDKNQFMIGHKYKIDGEFFDIDSILVLKHNILMDSLGSCLIFKQENNTNMTLFTLTKQDCDFLDIPYEEGLFMLPSSLNYVDINNIRKEYNVNDLSTYPIDYNDLTMHEINVICDGFFEKNDYYMFIDGTQIPKERFPFVHIRVKKNIKSINGSLPIFVKSRYTTKPSFFKVKNRTMLGFTIKFSNENNVGINPQAVSNEKLCDLFDITLVWTNEKKVNTIKSQKEETNAYGYSDRNYGIKIASYDFKPYLTRFNTRIDLLSDLVQDYYVDY